MGPGPGQVVIDAGCGKGAFSHQLWRYGCDVTGIGWSAEALRRARRAMSGGQVRRLRYLQHDLNTDSPPEVESSSIAGGVRRCARAWAVPLSSCSVRRIPPRRPAERGGPGWACRVPTPGV
ncbi:methyltransferase domain-containing protein [Streptomyces syringium]|uniref:methyltransferase domain-containing protein n=1 Tax=Streptomyces syringium TaxID=76729 RepID=UPI003654B4E8